jgi:hypothetical protein
MESDMEPTLLTDLLNLLLFPLFVLQVMFEVLSDAARTIGFLP